MSDPSTIRIGLAAFKRPGGLIGRSWASKELVLAEDALIVRPPPPRSSRTTTTRTGTAIPLASITALERVDLTPCCLSLQVSASVSPSNKAKSKSKHYYLSFDSDAALYDWQEDIYVRAPLLGGYSSAPFNFVHEAHVGYESGVDTYAEMVSKASLAPLQSSSRGHNASVGSTSKSKTATVSLTKGMGVDGDDDERDEKRALGDDEEEDTHPILSGLSSIKQQGSLTGGWFWRTRWLVLTSRVLAVYRSEHAPVPTLLIPLPSLLSIERVVHRRPYCLLLETRPGGRTGGRKYFLSFESDRELYAWNDAVYGGLHGGGGAGGRQGQGQGGGSIGLPTNVVHRVHVGVDAKTGEFTSLPAEWRATLQPHANNIPSSPSPSPSPTSAPAPSSTTAKSSNSKSKRTSTQSARRTSTQSARRTSVQIQGQAPPTTAWRPARAEHSGESADTLIER